MRSRINVCVQHCALSPDTMLTPENCSTSNHHGSLRCEGARRGRSLLAQIQPLCQARLPGVHTWSTESVSRATSRCRAWGLSCIPPSMQLSFSTETPLTWLAWSYIRRAIGASLPEALPGQGCGGQGILPGQSTRANTITHHLFFGPKMVN